MKFLDDENYKMIRKKFEQPNVFLIFENESDEIRHSNFLKWILDPQERHGVGPYFLSKFVKALDSDDFGSLDQVCVEREKDYIDLLIYNDRSVLVIENKVKGF
jgi:hypothetical protein